MAYDQERSFCRYYARIGLPDAKEQPVERLLSERLDWHFILQDAQNQEVAQILYYHLSCHKENLPQFVLSTLRDSFIRTKDANLQFYAELKDILAGFAENNIECIPLKGIDLAKRVYPDVGLRPMSDIDLLIKKHDLPKIERVLIPLDYLMHPGYHNMLNKPNSPYLNTVVCKKLIYPFISLHLHWHILNNTFYPGYGYISNLNIEKVWQDVQPAAIDNIKMLRMSPDCLLLHLAYHHFKHHFDRLILLTDIDAILNYYCGILDWQRIMHDAVEFNFNRPLYYSLYFAKEILGSDVPDDMLLKLRPERMNRFEHRFVDSVLKGRPSKNLSFFMFLAMNKGILKKIRFIFRSIFPHPKFISQLKDIYGINSSLKYSLNHLTRIFKYTLNLFLKR
ncbi:nucleotidyltransferase family protein [Candidatus Omnitrophota bacterium]